MDRDPQTAAELQECALQWDVGARPKDLEYDPPRPTTPRHIPWEWWETIREHGIVHRGPVSLARAIDLHVASGIRWLMEKRFSVHLDKMTEGVLIYIGDSPGKDWGEWLVNVGTRPTLFLAIHAAILAAKENRTC